MCCGCHLQVTKSSNGMVVWSSAPIEAACESWAMELSGVEACGDYQANKVSLLCAQCSYVLIRICSCMID